MQLGYYFVGTVYNNMHDIVFLYTLFLNSIGESKNCMDCRDLVVLIGIIYLYILYKIYYTRIG